MLTSSNVELDREQILAERERIRNGGALLTELANTYWSELQTLRPQRLYAQEWGTRFQKLPHALGFALLSIITGYGAYRLLKRWPNPGTEPAWRLRAMSATPSLFSAQAAVSTTWGTCTAPGTSADELAQQITSREVNLFTETKSAYDRLRQHKPATNETGHLAPDLHRGPIYRRLLTYFKPAQAETLVDSLVEKDLS